MHICSHIAWWVVVDHYLNSLDIDPASIRKQYLEQLTAYLDELQYVCRQVPVDYTLFNTKEAYEVVLRNFFARQWGGIR